MTSILCEASITSTIVIAPDQENRDLALAETNR